MRRFVAILAVALMAAAGRADDGPVTIKVKQPGPGERVKETKTENATQKASFMGMAKEDKIGTKFVYTEEVVERPAGAKRPTKLKRTYETATMTKDGTETDLGLTGKTVLIEKKGDGYDVTVDGKPVSGLAGDLLKKEFAKEKQVNDQDLLPKEPVKVGGTWKIDLGLLAKDVADELAIDTEKSSATGKLTKVYDKGGHKFGVVEITMDLAVTKAGDGPQAIKLEDGSKMHVTAVLDTCIDGSKADVTGKMSITGTLTGMLMGKELKIELSSVKDGTSEDLGKK